MLPTLTPLAEFLETDDGGFVSLKGHRAGLHHLVRSYNQGASAEEIAIQYPSLKLSTIHKVIAYYLENREHVDQYIAAHDAAMHDQIAKHVRHGPTLEEMQARLAVRERSRAIAG